MASNATSFGVMNLESNLWSHLSTLNVEETAAVNTILAFDPESYLLDVMSASMEDREKEHSIGNLSMEPH